MPPNNAKNKVDLLYKELSFKVQGSAFEVRKDFGLGHKEQIYQKGFEEELKRRKIVYEREPAIKIYSPKDGTYIGLYRPDFVVDGKIIVELKAQVFLPKAEIKKIYDYLRNSDYELGYLINFGSEQLYVKRIIYTEKNKPRTKQILASFSFLLALISVLFLGSSKASAAVLYSAAANQDVYEGQSFVVDWFLDTEGKPINALDLKLNFSKDTLAVADVNTGNSLISLWINNPKADNDTGKIELTGGMPNGANAGNIPIFRTVFQAKTSGPAFINLDSSSVVLLNDGSGSSDLLKFKNETFNVYPKDFLPAAMTSPTHPDQNLWYKNRDMAIRFTPKSGEDYSYSFSSNIEIIPDDQKQEVPSEIKYPNLPDGIYYFKLNSKIGPSNWKEAAVYRVQIDATAPEAFTPAIGSDPSVFGGNSFVSFSTVDKTSGMSHYKVKVGLFGNSRETQSPYKLRKPLVGNSVAVTAFDAAGNQRQAVIAWPGYISTKIFVLILIALGLLAIGFYFRRNLMRILLRK